MSFLDAIILGFVQGATEFLPVSSSGHLVLFGQVLGLQEPQLTFDIFLHLATLLAVLFFFRKNLIKLKLQDWIKIAIGTIPAVLVGLFLKDWIEGLFAIPTVVGITLMITGLLNLVTDRKLQKPEKNEKDTESKPQNSLTLSVFQGFIIGCFQALAIIPGISRSGSTLLGGLSQKLNRQEAFKFSFYLSIPAILGASILQIKDLLEIGSNHIEWPIYIAGMLSALITGLIGLKIFKYIIDQARLEIFGWYCLVIGGGFLAFNLFFV